MRFTIEQRHLTDISGKPIAGENNVSFHVGDAESAEEAVRAFVVSDGGEIIGTVLKFPGFQAVATVRRPTGVYTLQVTPASQQFIVRP
ncbi:MAG TPA: hypothetical protein VJ276_19195 [Thermoanaerobaculia bacterium]|nr:hypothetical protein [Thermoanaerobaculia bacterium]